MAEELIFQADNQYYHDQDINQLRKDLIEKFLKYGAEDLDLVGAVGMGGPLGAVGIGGPLGAVGIGGPLGAVGMVGVEDKFALPSIDQDFRVLALKIAGLDHTLKNPLYIVKKDLQDLCRMILGLAFHISPEDIITMALRNGPRDDSQSKKVQVSKKHTIVKVEPNPSKGIASMLIDTLIYFVVRLYHSEGIKPSPTLLGNFGPVREETIPIGDLKVKGRIPETLNGMMIRNGPNPVFDPLAHYYWLDGDSMIHAIHFKKEKATCVSRYVRTSRFKQEQYHRGAQFLQYGDLHGEFGLFMACMQLLKEKFGVIDMSHGWLNANTGVVYHNEMLMILQDWDKPYAIDVLENGDLNTLGINNYNNKLLHSVTPHPKKDPVTGELFILGSSNTPPYATLSIVSKEGDMSVPFGIETSGASYMHDFGLTEKYVIVMDLPFYYDPKKMLEQGTWIYSFAKKKSSFGIFRRDSKSNKEIKWFNFDESFFIFHNGNSWEEDEDTVVLVSLVLEPKITIASKENKTKENPSHRVDNPFRTLALDEAQIEWEIFFKPPHLFAGRNTDGGFTNSKLFKFSFNLKTGEAKKTLLSANHFEYPIVNGNYIGRKSKYVYLCELDDKIKIPAIVKYNLEMECETKLNFGENKYGSEVSFVPRQYPTLFEDDGYLTTFVHDEKSWISFAYVLSALRMEFLAKIELPNRVPYGFHATFVTEEEFHGAKDFRTGKYN